MNPNRPRFHFAPEKNWMNDPFPFFDGEKMHLFYQYNPEGNVWGKPHWGHAVSTDMLNWKEREIALSPGESYDAGGCWSGSIVEHQGRYFLFYTGVEEGEKLVQSQCVAFSGDLETWNKHPVNPILSEAPAGFGPCFRDPRVYREKDSWRMAVGSQVEGRGGAVLQYRSDDLMRWDLMEALFSDDLRTGHESEVPDFFELDNHPIVLTSCHRTWIHRGEYSGHHFKRTHSEAADGKLFYAAQTVVEKRGRRLIVGWVKENQDKDRIDAQGWAGCASLPREMFVERNELKIRPLSELEQLRDGEPETLEGDLSGHRVFKTNGLQLDLVVKIGHPAPEELKLKLRTDSEGNGGQEFLFRPFDSMLCGRPYALGREDVELRIVLDGSVAELFAPPRFCHTERVYGGEEEAYVSLEATAGGAGGPVPGSVTLHRLKV
ncbi:MAG: glycoside hydrolase family 32 protein [Fimbriimonadaceae bacterium]